MKSDKILKESGKMLLISAIILSFISFSVNAISDNPNIVYFFYGQGCPHCAEESVFLDHISENYANVTIERYEIYYNQSNIELLSDMCDSYGAPFGSVPLVFIGDDYILGFGSNSTTGVEIEDAINENFFGIDMSNGNDLTFTLPFVGEIDVSSMSLPLITIIIGLLDGFNPCAMFVLCFLLVFLIGTKSRKKTFIIGGIFLTMSALVYFLFISAWFNFFLIFKYVPVLKAIVAVIVVFAGLVNIKDYFYFQKGLSFTLPKKWKSVITERMEKLSKKENILAMIAGVISVALVVNIVELMCTVGFPMIYTQLLSTYNLSKPVYYSYIALYCLFYMIDDMVVFAVAVITLNCMEMTKKRVRQMKLISGILMILLALWFLMS